MGRRAHRAGQLKQVFILKTGVRIPLGSLGLEIDRCLSPSLKTGVRIPLGSFTFEKDMEPIGSARPALQATAPGGKLGSVLPYRPQSDNLTITV